MPDLLWALACDGFTRVQLTHRKWQLTHNLFLNRITLNGIIIFMPSTPKSPPKPVTLKRDHWLTIAGTTAVIIGSILYCWYRGW
jgi:hypothetical protein